MSLIPKRIPGFSQGRRVDFEGELYSPPGVLSYVWPAVVLLLIIEACGEIFGMGGPTAVYERLGSRLHLGGICRPHLGPGLI
jgi:hypothetical protein